MKTLLIAATLAFSPTTVPPQSAAPSIAVEYGDLDLATEAGAAKLEGRIANAARRMCKSGARGIDALRFEAACRNDVMDRHRETVRLAVARSNAAPLAAAKATPKAPGA